MTIQLIQIGSEELKDLVRASFGSDSALCEKYHLLAPARSIDIADHTYNAIMEDNDYVTMKFMKVVWRHGNESATIGFTVLVSDLPGLYNVLYSFCIIEKYRLRFILQEWLSVVQKHLGTYFTVSLWNKNTRAINFFLKNGFEIREKKEKHTILLINKEL